MNKLIDKFVEWALHGNHWPLLLPLSIPVLFKVIQKYFSLSFKETVWHWSFLSATGIVLFVSGGSYLTTSGQGWGRRFLALALCFLGTALFLKAYRQYRPPILPTDRLVVAIAPFEPISKAAANDAKNIPNHVEERLEELRANGAPLEIRRLRTRVKGADEKARQKKAVSLGTSGSNSAHVVLWGEVRKDDGELFVRPRLTVARQFRDIQIEERQLRPFKSDEPKHLDFKEGLAKQIVDLVILVYGLAYYKVDNWDKAIEILSQANTDEAYFYKALALSRRAGRAAGPQQKHDLRAAIGNYGKVLGAAPLNLTTDLTWKAYVGRADAVAVLGMISPPGESQKNLREAVEAYREAIRIYPAGTLSRQEWTNFQAFIQTKLGAALHLLGQRVEGDEGVHLLREAVSAFKAVRKDFRNTYITTLIKSESSLGETLHDLAIRVEGEERVQILRDAVDVYRHLLPILSDSKLLVKFGVKGISPEVSRNIQKKADVVLHDLSSLEGKESSAAIFGSR